MADSNKSSTSIVEQLQGFELGDIDWQNMGSWPAIGKIAFCVMLLVVGVVVSYLALFQGQLSSLESLERQEQQLKRDFETKAFRVANLDEYKTQMVEMEASFGSLLKQLPKDTEVPGLIDDISAAALNAGLELKRIDPADMKKSEFYKELPINIEVSGGYHEMGAFVSGVASLPRIVTLHDFNIVKTKGQERLSMEIEAKTYQYDADSRGQ
ncbi:type 4a pilus biogenesis protein PilO [Thalassolituus sp. UBA3500]|uniref:type 4a pilus biogenesis protein PilO n=1 Tax=Thalassolituus sp. UBA3500 TaxID=1947664 RepID=UPI000C0FA977|nr:type 4a pilus biogenesis protein PilO [Thalassolituus sp. UBA3500]MBN59557.1 pilus assembly protein PilP [Oceanospirillaceae bacterium]|tara:strand:- start:19079 stop:19711 length:633 start_codon:yes stop_codon:yes gene_type:complete